MFFRSGVDPQAVAPSERYSTFRAGYLAFFGDRGARVMQQINSSRAAGIMHFIQAQTPNLGTHQHTRLDYVQLSSDTRRLYEPTV